MTQGALPNYQKLYEMGKLPDEHRDKIPGLKQLDEANKKIKELEEKVDDPKKEEIIEEIRCSFTDCEFIGKNDRGLKIHQKSHTR